ncbi:MAG: hypothetical protein ACXVBG_23500 [Isosphaeraceae bacterium]
MRLLLPGLFAFVAGCSTINLRGSPSPGPKREDVPAKDKAISVTINPGHGYATGPNGPQYSPNKGVGVNWNGLTLSR